MIRAQKPRRLIGSGSLGWKDIPNWTYGNLAEMISFLDLYNWTLNIGLEIY